MKKKITKNPQERQITRRQMVGSALAAAGVITGAPTFLRALNLHNKLNIAMVACGGRALANMNGDGGSRRRASDAPSGAPTGIPAENITVLCDVNQNAVDAAAQRFPKAKKYNDFRRVFDHANDFDAVMVSTTEHTHTLATYLALTHGKHVTLTNAMAIAAADFDRDGNLDLAVADSKQAGQVVVLRGNGRGTFTQLGAFVAGENPSAIAVGDLNGDGFPDIAVTNSSVSLTTAGPANLYVTVLTNQQGVRFSSTRLSPNIETGSFGQLQSVVITDLNRSLFPAIVVTLSGAVDNLVTIQSLGRGLFDAPHYYATDGGGTGVAPSYLAVASDPFIRATTFTVQTTLVSTDLVNNGNFETPDLTGETGNLIGWQKFKETGSHGDWTAQSNPSSPLSAVPVPPAPQGRYAAMLDQSDAVIPQVSDTSNTQHLYNSSNLYGFNGIFQQPSDYEGMHILYQDVTIPATASKATLSFSLYINNTNSFIGYTDPLLTPTLDYFPNVSPRRPNQQVRVDLIDAQGKIDDVGGGVFRNLFVTTPTTDLDFGAYRSFTFDVTAFAGRTVRLRFASVNNQGKLIVGVDNVSVQAVFDDRIAPGVNNLHLRNPGFGATTSFGGNTVDTTILGQVTDVVGVNDIAYVAFDLRNSGTTFSNGQTSYKVTDFDGEGNFQTLLPLSLPGIYTVGVTAVSRGGGSTRSTITFNYQGPSLSAWQSVGPAPIRYDNQGANYKTVSGHITSIDLDPRDPNGNIIYVGTDNGGVWKTTDGGANWTPLTDYVTDDSGAPVPIAIGGVAVDPRTPDTIYAATGVADNQVSSQPGVGVLKSIDGGKTWTLVGNSVLAGARVSKIAVSRPGRDGLTSIYVAVAAGGAFGPGVYRSQDGGATWKNVLDPTKMFQDNNTTLPAGTALASVTDLFLDRLSDFEENLYIGLGNIGMVANSDTGGLWKSPNRGDSWFQVVGGHDPKNGLVNWSPLNNNGPTGIDSTRLPSASTYPNGGGLAIGRVSIGQAQGRIQDEPILYVLIGRPPSAQGDFTDRQDKSEVGNGLADSFGLFKSKNGGLSWTHVMLRENVPTSMPNKPRNWLNLFTMGFEANSVGALAVDPNDPNIVYVGGSNRYFTPANITPNFLEFSRAHGFIRVDTRNMRDTDFDATIYYPPSALIIIPNDGDDIIKAGDAVANEVIGGAMNFREKGRYAGMGGVTYEGEGVFWYDLETTDAGQQNVNLLIPQILVPAVIHTLVFDPLGRLLIGTEGGLYRGVSQGWSYDTTDGAAGAGQVFTDKSKSDVSMETDIGVSTPFEPGMIFTDLNGNLQIADMTSVAIDPYDRHTLDSSQQSSGWARTTGSLQWESTDSFALGALGDPFADDGPFAGAVRTGPRDPTAAPGTPSTVYRVFANIVDVQLQISVSQASGAQGSFLGAIKGLDLGGLIAAFPPLTMNPKKLLDVNGVYQDEILYGAAKIFETDNGAAAWDQVSAALGANADVLTALAFGPGSDVFYAGTRRGQIFVDLHGGGDGFPNRTAGLPAGATINGITVDPRDDNTAYVMLGGGNRGHVFRTSNGGLTWTDVSGNLPNFSTYSMVIDPRSLPGAPNGKIYLGTQVGVFLSVDGAASWTQLGNGMPNVPVKDLQFNQDFEEIVAGTFGRGAFEISTQVGGPRVLAVGPSTPSSPGLSTITVTFDHPVDPRTFTPSSIRALTGPGGPVTVLAVNDTDPVNHLTFQIVFSPQVADGVYTLTLAPTIQDFLSNRMDENGNLVNGEDPGDTFSAHFVINTSDNGRFVTGLYHDLLARQADTDGFIGFDNTVESARFAFLQPTAQGFLTSDEARADTIYNGVITPQHPNPTGYYQTLLGRAASAAEIAGWLQNLKQGMSPEQVVAAFASSAEFFQLTGSNDPTFVSALYTNRSILGRSVAPGLDELNGWLSVLSQSELSARSGIVNIFVHSDEYRVLLIHTYFTKYLGRPASAADVGSWLPQLQRGMTDELFLAAILASDEYFNNHGGTNASWLAAVYNDVFNRPLDAVGQAIFQGQFQAGASRTSVAQQLVTSNEYRTDLIQADFTKYLGRAANAADITIYLGSLQSGVSDEGIVTAVVSSAEYFVKQQGSATTLAGNDVNWVNAVYRDVLGRAADSVGSSNFVQILNQGESSARGGVVQAFVTSVEYRAHLITVTYTTYLMRAPSAQEISLWMPLLSKPSAGPGKPSQDEVFTSIVLGSNEYFFRPEQRGPDGLTSNSQWLTSLYNKLLGRAPDTGGLTSFLVNILNGYQSQRLALATSVDTSTEYRANLVSTFFKTYLRRAASAAENAGRVAQLAAGFTDEQLISSLVSSTEYFQNPQLGASDNSKWLNQAYRDILGRDRDTAGSQGFLTGLNNNTLTRGQVADALLSSDEYHRRLIAQFFTTYLGRSPSAAETTLYLNAIAAKAKDEQIIAQIVASAEYFERSHAYP